MAARARTSPPRASTTPRKHGIDTVFQDLALIDELTVFQNLFLHREPIKRPIPFVNNALMKREARKALDQIGINIPHIDVPAARLSGGQRQAIAVARTISGDADIILLDEPLAAMGAKEGAMILDLIQRLKDEGNVSIIMILHNYVHVLTACDRVNLIQDGVIGARQADRRDVGRGADRDRRRGVPPRPPGGPPRRGRQRHLGAGTGAPAAGGRDDDRGACRRRRQRRLGRRHGRAAGHRHAARRVTSPPGDRR